MVDIADNALDRFKTSLMSLLDEIVTDDAHVSVTVLVRDFTNPDKPEARCFEFSSEPPEFPELSDSLDVATQKRPTTDDAYSAYSADHACDGCAATAGEAPPSSGTPSHQGP